jgi:hypothetical protein
VKSLRARRGDARHSQKTAAGCIIPLGGAVFTLLVSAKDL